MEIIFNGLMQVSDKIKIVFPHVTVYGGERYNGTEMGVSRDDFDRLVGETEYYYDFDDECFFLRALKDDAGEENNPRVVGANIREGEEWIWFEGTPLFYINLLDKKDNRIFTGDYCKFDDGFEGVVEYEPQGGLFIVRNKAINRYKDFRGVGMTGSDVIRVDGIETLGNAIMVQQKK